MAFLQLCSREAAQGSELQPGVCACLPPRSAKKVLVDQLTFGPLCNGLFLAFMASVVEGRGWAGTRWVGAARRCLAARCLSHPGSPTGILRQSTTSLALALAASSNGAPGGHWLSFSCPSLPWKGRAAPQACGRGRVHTSAWPCPGLHAHLLLVVVLRRDKLRHDFAGVQQRGWRLWPLASFISQQFVPLQLRVLWLNAVAFLWSLFLILCSSAGARGSAALAAAAGKGPHKA